MIFCYALFMCVSQCYSAPVLQAIFGSKNLIDLSYAYNNETIYWPGDEAKGVAFRRNITHKGKVSVQGQLVYYETASFSSGEHGGTHIDSPSHFKEGGIPTDEIPLTQLMGPAVRIDISNQSAINSDYRLSVDDVKAYESEFGRIPDGAIILVFSDWGKFYPNRTEYVGNNESDVSNLHFPTVHPDAASFLVNERDIKAIGIDTCSPDNPSVFALETHVILAEANIVIIENVANLDLLPPTGANIIGLPLKIEGGSGGPIRMFAWW